MSLYKRAINSNSNFNFSSSSSSKIKFNFKLKLSLVLLASINLWAPATFAQLKTAITEKDTEKIPAASDANTSYTPLMLPEDAAQRGISLSGEAKLYRQEQGHYKLGCGCILVHTEEPIYISTCRANVFADAGSTIVIGAKADATRILNLSDRKHDSVRVIFDSNHVALNPGEELSVVGAKADDADQKANEHVIRFRNAESIAVSPEYKALLFEFSLADAMKHCLIFKQLSSSPAQEDKKLLSEIIKTAAAVNTMYKKRDKYTHGDDNTQDTQIADNGSTSEAASENNKNTNSKNSKDKNTKNKNTKSKSRGQKQLATTEGKSPGKKALPSRVALTDSDESTN